MSRLAKAMVLFVIVFHTMAFVGEAFLWMRPGVYEFALSRFQIAVPLALHEQALVLKPVFVNQGFYNLFLAVAGVVGLLLIRRGKAEAGRALVGYMCASAVGAGIVLAFTSIAYIGALLQALPAAIALAVLFRPSSTRAVASAAA
jgi:putative membrane protein